MAQRRRSSAIHLFCGLYAAIFVVALGLSGAILAFHDEIDRALNPKLFYVTPHGTAKPLAELTATVLRAYPQYKLQGVQLPTRTDLSTLVIVGDPRQRSVVVAVAIDQYTGAILGDSEHSNNFVDHVRDFHTSLMLGGFGSALVWFSGVGCVALSITGVILWWRRRRLAPSMPGAPTFNLDFHSAAGIYVSLFLLIFGFTAMRVVPAGLVVPRDYIRPPQVKIEAQPGAQPLSMEAQLEAARKALPGADPVFISTAPNFARPTFVAMRYPEDHSERPKSGVLLNPFTGAAVQKVDLRSLNAFQKYAWAWNMEIHTGAIFGEPSKIVAAALCLVIPLLGVTGPVIWWKRRKASVRTARLTVGEILVR